MYSDMKYLLISQDKKLCLNFLSISLNSYVSENCLLPNPLITPLCTKPNLSLVKNGCRLCSPLYPLVAIRKCNTILPTFALSRNSLYLLMYSSYSYVLNTFNLFFSFHNKPAPISLLSHEFLICDFGNLPAFLVFKIAIHIIIDF